MASPSFDRARFIERRLFQEAREKSDALRAGDELIAAAMELVGAWDAKDNHRLVNAVGWLRSLVGSGTKL